MALTDTAILLEYREARDTLVEAISAGESYIEIEIRNRRWKQADTVKLLAFVEKQITYYENRINNAAGRSRNNYARIKR